MPRNFKIYITTFLSVLILTSIAQRNTFINYSLEEGLPQSSVISLYQDSNGNIWIGTQGGVCKYNGKTFTTFDTRHGLGGNHITAISQDKKRRYWFGHRYKGLSLMQGKDILHIDLTKERINVIKEDLNGNIWIGTDGDGIFILPEDKEVKAENFIQLFTHPDSTTSKIYDIFVEDTGKVWAGTNSGIRIIKFGNNFQQPKVLEFNIENSCLPFQRVLSIIRENDSVICLLGYDGLAKVHRKKSPDFKKVDCFPFNGNIQLNFLHNIICDKTGTIWGTGDYGIFQLKNKVFKFYTPETGLFNDLVNTMIHDHEDNIWIGTMNSGIYKYSGDKFLVFDNQSGLIDNVVNSVIEDNEGNIWISTGKGVSKFDGKKYRHFTTQNGLLSNSVDVLFEDSKGNIWMGYYLEGGLMRYDPQSGKFRTFTTDDGLMTNSVITINEDKDGNVWFATLGYGVSKYTYPDKGNPENFETYTVEDGLCSNIIWTIHKDRQRNLWFGSDNAGLTKYNGKSFTTYNEKDGLTNLSVGAITHDSRNNLWIATIGGGIFKFDGTQFTNYSLEDGLGSDSPYSIICDDMDYVWIGTNSGIDKFDPVNEVFKHYDKADGFLGIESNQNAICKSRDGILLFGTINGVIRFDPAKDYLNTIPPVTTIENIKLFFNDFDYNSYSDSIHPETLLPVGMVLPYNKNHLTFGYIGVSLTSPDKVWYQYKLENFDPDWIPLTQSTIATYTNIPPGDYILKVKACNNDGFWNDKPASFSFTIQPAFWQTWWFRILAFLFIISLVSLFIRLRIRNINAQKVKLKRLVDEKTLELQQEAKERKIAQEKAEQADMLKTAFLANMSHEIRTPVSSIIGFADLLKEGTANNIDKDQCLDHIVMSGKNLLNLINDIIDISKIEAGQVRIENEEFKLNSLIAEIFTTFYEKINKKEKDIILKIKRGTPDKNFTIVADPYRLQQVLTNLIGNALKFTDSGFIEFGYSIESSDKLLFFVKDSGIGIPKDKQEIIFDRFFQVEESYTNNKDGTGLGLAISEKLTELLGGKMWVESELGKGSTFFFTVSYESVEKGLEFDEEIEAKEIDYNWEGKNILLVEDEYVNYLLIENYLTPHNVNIIGAADGISAVEICRKSPDKIDLVLMDIKIPGINGYEATKEIKKLNKDIPVIAQTAYAMIEEMEKCQEAGCDDYIAKPYDRDKLLAKVNKFLAKK